ncbi:hypothetical protein DPMN_124142 [Dreissena polymorpha]|uniref:Uncharacterized protein n=1 Tax=Dreissena polymorpha TaxID=45954 RepID=A0A9D4JTK2_DREPO|nr:hypothetical protein DPMN_124142 [Dreissena polymorpha]
MAPDGRKDGRTDNANIISLHLWQGITRILEEFQKTYVLYGQTNQQTDRPTENKLRKILILYNIIQGFMTVWLTGWSNKLTVWMRRLLNTTSTGWSRATLTQHGIRPNLA